MLVNVSYNNKQIDNKIDQQVGKPYSLPERFKLKGIGSPKLIITQTSHANSQPADFRQQQKSVQYRDAPQWHYCWF